MTNLAKHPATAAVVVLVAGTAGCDDETAIAGENHLGPHVYEASGQLIAQAGIAAAVVGVAGVE